MGQLWLVIGGAEATGGTAARSAANGVATVIEASRDAVNIKAFADSAKHSKKGIAELADCSFQEQPWSRVERLQARGVRIDVQLPLRPTTSIGQRARADQQRQASGTQTQYLLARRHHPHCDEPAGVQAAPGPVGAAKPATHHSPPSRAGAKRQAATVGGAERPRAGHWLVGCFQHQHRERGPTFRGNTSVAVCHRKRGTIDLRHALTCYRGAHHGIDGMGHLC